MDGQNLSYFQEVPELLKAFRAPAFSGSFFLSFEGIEGAGKTTQINRTRDYLEKKGHRVLILREPGGTPFGERLRNAVLSSTEEIHPVAELSLFTSSRAQLMSEVTLVELNTPGTVIIYDRYIDSSMAYQGIARGLGIKTVLAFHQVFPLFLMPHLTLYLRIDLETSLERQRKRKSPKDYFESRGPKFYQNLIDGYDQAVDLFPDRIKVIPGHHEEIEVFENIKTSIDRYLQANQ